MSDENTIPTALDLEYHTGLACDQLKRYGGSVFSVELLNVLTKLSDINDDLHHGRTVFVCEGIKEAKSLLDILEVAQ